MAKSRKEKNSVIIWAVLDGFSRYEISNYGLVRYSDTKRFCPDYDDGKSGYRKIKIYPDGVKGSSLRKSFYIHRLVWLAFNGPIPARLEVDHADGNRVNNRLDNLVLATHKQNCLLKKQRDSRYLFNRKAPIKKNPQAREGV
jgi:hypothetical protein